jgi:hypothetical protein
MSSGPILERSATRELPLGATFVALSGLGLGVAREVDLNALGKEAFTPTLTAASKDGAATFGFHTGAESELLFARPLGRLVGAFGIHKLGNSIGKRAETLPAPPPLSTGSMQTSACENGTVGKISVRGRL